MDGRTGVAGFPQGRRETVENTPRTPPGTRSPRRAHVERLVRHRTDETIGLRTLVLRCGPALRCGSLLTALDMRKPPRYGGCRAKPALADLFTDVLVLCARAGVVSVGLVAVDGSLIAANASRQATKSYRAVREEVERILQQAADADAEDDERFGTRAATSCRPIWPTRGRAASGCGAASSSSRRSRPSSRPTTRPTSPGAPTGRPSTAASSAAANRSHLR